MSHPFGKDTPVPDIYISGIEVHIKFDNGAKYISLVSVSWTINTFVNKLFEDQQAFVIEIPQQRPEIR